LGADGVVLMTSVAGRYAGDADYAELWAELDRRRAVVALHPASPPGWEQTALGRPRPMIEFPFDTTRCVVDLALGGTLTANPHVRLIVPHAGSALPVLVDRVAGFTKAIAPGDGDPVDVVGLLADLHYDLAGDATPRALAALLTLTSPERLLYGSDVPFPPPPVVAMLAGRLLASDELEESTRKLMLSENASRLFPRLAAGDGAGA
jgi:predicted TIM-barrel fold metal-dependent hydrolase